VSFMIARLTLAVLLVGLAAPAAWGQGNAAAGATDAKAAEVLLSGARYDVATIKPFTPGTESSFFEPLPNGGFMSKGMTLKSLVCEAYDKFDFQCLGGPSWLDSDRYDVEAKPDSALADQMLKLNWKERTKVRKRMQQALLEDRIKLKVHQETREMPIFALVVAKGGSKMTEAKTEGSYMVDHGKMQAWGTSMDSLAQQLSQETGHIVQDRTGLKGVYEFTLKYSDEVAAGADPSAPSLYSALQEQLGLKLEPSKGAVEVLVIDHVERPSEN
jgi:uncharacterized protein (TIGR03435 family)